MAQGGPEGLRAEAVSNAFLTPEEQLDADAIRSLSKLGWTDPDPEKSSPNYFRDWETPVPYSDVSSLMVRTLSEVLAAPSPNVLRYRAFAKGGPEIIIPTLGIIREPLHTDRRTEVSQPTTASSPEELLDQVKAVMKPILGTEEVLTDEEGDIPVRYGNVMVYVRVSKDQPLVRVFSPVVWDIGSPSDILETVNEMNGEMLFARAQWNGTGVTLSSDVMGAPLESDQL